jgi:hypothetical protein
MDFSIRPRGPEDDAAAPAAEQPRDAQVPGHGHNHAPQHTEAGHGDR